MRRILLAALAAATVIGGATACDKDDSSAPIAPTGPPTTASQTPQPTEPVAPSTPLPSESLVGLPPAPGAAARAAYIVDLKAIKPALVVDQDQAVERGRQQCAEVKRTPLDQAKLVSQTNKRFTTSEAPKGYGTAVAVEILIAVRRHLCPTLD